MLLALAVLLLGSLCSVVDGELRLTGGRGPHEGNIEMLVVRNKTRVWRYVCDDNWGARDAKVACRELGFERAVKAKKSSYFPIRDELKGLNYNGTYGASYFRCSGGESSLESCVTGSRNRKKCNGHLNAAGVVCSNNSDKKKLRTEPKPSKASGDAKVELKLVGEAKHGFISSGYLEVLYDGVWGSVCADGWTNTESFVACGNLGYPDIDNNAIFPDALVSSSTPYWMKNVKCSGSESKLYECDHSGWSKHSCKKNHPVYLHCQRSPLLRDNRFDRALISNHDVRLRAGYRHSEGRVEVKYKGEWGSICDDNWSIQNANVFCRQLGFGTAFAATHKAFFGQGTGKIWMDEVKCKGKEKSILKCKRTRWGKSDCGHKEDAGVKCHYPYGKPEAQIRLKGSNNPLQGAIEIMHKGRWRGICGIGWGLREAEVVCRQLGLGYPQKALSTSRYGIPRRFALHNVKCSGDELSVTHCHYVGRKGRCRYYDVASVHCTPNAPDLVMDIGELKFSLRAHNEKLERLGCAYEENCLASDAVHQWPWPDRFNRTLLRFTSRFWNRGTATFFPYKKKSLWIWHQCHQHYHSMARFSDYDITDANGDRVAEGHKASFCIEDYECEKGMQKKYQCANHGDQGMQVNCADTYRHHLDCQWVDITKLPSGEYTLRVVLNPQNMVYETDYSNNIASCDIQYNQKEKAVTVGSCRFHPCEKMSWGGVGGGSCCKFPFTYKGKQYHSCTHDGPNGLLWCATTSNFDKDGLWGRC